MYSQPYLEYKETQYLKEHYFRNKLSCKNPEIMDTHEKTQYVKDHDIDLVDYLFDYAEFFRQSYIDIAGELPCEVMDILELLYKHSENSYIVGGCVRDILLERTPKDFDFVTDIPYDKLIKIFKKDGYSIKETGKQFLVLMVIKDGNEYEIANFRKDGTYIDGRRPDSVQIGTIEDDAQRRDFTVNALYWNVYNGLTYPNMDSITDIMSKTLRFIGKPEDRLKEDYLRGFRFYRFIRTKGLIPAKKSLKAVRTLWSDIMKTDPERARVEIERML